MRNLFALLALLCLLTACGTTVSPTDTPTQAPTASSSSLPTATPIATTPQFTLPETATLPPRETLPPIARYTDALRYGFVPADDYGAVYPFFDRVFLNVFYDSTMIYGFVDAQGRIVCDACFRNVKLLTRDGDSVYAAYENTADANRYSEIIAPDGSWSYQTIESYSLGDMWVTLPAFNGEKWGAIDWQGQVVVPFEYDAPVYSDGQTITVLYVDGTTLSVLYKSVQTGETIGPYALENDWLSEYLPLPLSYVFNDDRARFMGDNGLYGYINRAGEVVIEPIFAYATGFEGGHAYVYYVDEDSNWIGYHVDTAGNINDSYSYEDEYKIVHGIYYASGDFYVVDTKQRITFEYDFGESFGYYISVDSIYIVQKTAIMQFNHNGKLLSTYTKPDETYYYYDFYEHSGRIYIAIGDYSHYLLLNDNWNTIAESRTQPKPYGDCILILNGATVSLIDYNGVTRFSMVVKSIGE